MGIASGFMFVWQEIAYGVVEKTTKDCQKYCDHWCDYANICTINPLFFDISCPIKRDVVVTEFASRVRSGVYGKNNTIKVQGFIYTIATIYKTIKLARKPSPLYRE